MKRILIVDDSEKFQEECEHRLRRYEVEIVSAYTTSEAREIYKKSAGNFDLIVMDGCVDEPDIFDTPELIGEIRQTFTGPMLAASTSPDLRQKMVEAGCSSRIPKDCVANEVIFQLKLPRRQSSSA